MKSHWRFVAPPGSCTTGVADLAGDAPDESSASLVALMRTNLASVGAIVIPST